ncbi:MAG: hypothetical protein U9Q83_08650 [Bacteroidota bacterium]|nr:hypothetical protein [Bacteroidota bacterium]
MEEDEFKNEMKIFSKFVVEKQATYHLINSFNLRFVIVPKIQE